MMSAVIDGRISQAHQLPVSFGKKYRSGDATSRNGTMNTPSTLVSGSTRSSRTIVTCAFYHAAATHLKADLTAVHASPARGTPSDPAPPNLTLAGVLLVARSGTRAQVRGPCRLARRARVCLRSDTGRVVVCENDSPNRR